jgi:hypothetical protein
MGAAHLSRRTVRIIKLVLFTLAGAALGLLYWKLVGCRTGACPLTSHPIRSSLYGAAVGFLAGWI